MDGCRTCQGLSERFNIATPDEYHDTARQLTGMVSRGSLILVSADCPLEDLFNPQWPGDVLYHYFQCANCGQGFQLFADTYHGHASWSPSNAPNPN